MGMTTRRAGAITAGARILCVGAAALLGGAALTAAPAQASTLTCPSPTPGQLTCAVMVSPAALAGTGISPSTTPAGYSPAQLQAAYGLQASDEGMRQTVALIEAGGDPDAESDLGVYRTQYGLPACTSSDGCLTIINQTGGTTLPPPDTGYTQQIPTDLDMVSAVCPNCHILLVEADDNSITNLGQAVDQAVSQGAAIVDFSYYGPEDPSETTQWDPYFNHPGVAITAAAGNTGYTGGPLNYPAASPHVTSVGGTVLDPSGATGCTAGQAGTRGWCETAWSQTTSGCSEYEPKPARQGNTGCTGRADNDIAAVASSTASPSTPVAVYDSYNNSGWVETGETGIAAPIIAGIYADAGTPGTSGNPAAYPYQHPGGGYINPNNAYPYFDGLNDITSGSTGSCSPSYLCTAGAGWDGPTGVGSPATTLSLTASGTTTSASYDDLGATDTCMDNNQGNLANGNKIDIWTCDNGVNSQQWTFQADGTIHAGTSSYCLDVSGGGTSNGTPIVLNSCDGQASQQWKIQASGQLVNQNSGTCLDNPLNSTTNGTQLQIWNCNSNIQQNWAQLSPVPASAGQIKLQPHTGDCIDNYQGNLTDSNKIDIWACDNGTNSQQWNIQSSAANDINASGYCMSVDTSGGLANGSLLILYTCNSHTEQKWIPQSNGSLRNLRSATCLDDPNDSTTNGTQLQIWNCNTNPQQNWQLP